VQRILNNWFVKWVLAPVAVLWALGWGYIQINYPTCTFRYKLTAEVMTPDELKSGSSVVEVSYSHNADWGGGPKTYDTLLGEAVFIDLGKGKNLFVTLGTLDSGRPSPNWYHINPLKEPADYYKMVGALNPIWLPIKMFELGRTREKEREMCQRVSKFYGTPAKSVPLNNLPTLVTFGDLRQPDTAATVNPNDLVATFGAGYTMAAKIEISNASVTNRIHDLLPWVPDHITDKVGGGANRLGVFSLFKFPLPTEETGLRN
jgi:hypothetical protein